jgi:chemotaxis protein CheC
MQAKLELTEKQIDILQEVSNIGVGHAATALSQMTGIPIRLKVTRAMLIPIESVPAMVGGPNRLVAGIFLKIYGQARGSILLVFPKESVSALLSLSSRESRTPDRALTDLDISAVKEIGNIMASSYLNAMSRLLEMILVPSVPGFAYDMAGAVLDFILIELGEHGDTALLIETSFGQDGDSLSGQLFLLPDPETLRTLLGKLER